MLRLGTARMYIIENIKYVSMNKVTGSKFDSLKNVGPRKINYMPALLLFPAISGHESS